MPVFIEFPLLHALDTFESAAFGTWSSLHAVLQDMFAIAPASHYPSQFAVWHAVSAHGYHLQLLSYSGASDCCSDICRVPSTVHGGFF